MFGDVRRANPTSWGRGLRGEPQDRLALNLSPDKPFNFLRAKSDGWMDGWMVGQMAVVAILSAWFCLKTRSRSTKGDIVVDSPGL